MADNQRSETYRAELRALAAGRLPDGVDPQSRRGRQYLTIIRLAQEFVASASPLSDDQKAAIRLLGEVKV